MKRPGSYQGVKADNSASEDHVSSEKKKINQQTKPPSQPTQNTLKKFHLKESVFYNKEKRFKPSFFSLTFFVTFNEFPLFTGCKERFMWLFFACCFSSKEGTVLKAF